MCAGQSKRPWIMITFAIISWTGVLWTKQHESSKHTLTTTTTRSILAHGCEMKLRGTHTTDRRRKERFNTLSRCAKVGQPTDYEDGSWFKKNHHQLGTKTRRFLEKVESSGWNWKMFAKIIEQYFWCANHFHLIWNIWSVWVVYALSIEPVMQINPALHLTGRDALHTFRIAYLECVKEDNAKGAVD